MKSRLREIRARRRIGSRDGHSVVRCFVVLLLFGAFSGCTTCQNWVANGFKVGPNYCRPVAAIEEQWIDFARDERLVSDSSTQDHWWTVFGDPLLEDLIHTAHQQNLTLREAGMRILQARAERNIAVGNLFPQSQQAFGDYKRVQNSQSLYAPASVRNFSQWESGVNLAWEIDFWGRFRRSIAAADAQLDASIEDYDNALVLLLADVAQTYVQIRTLQRRLELARLNVESQRGSVEIAEAQFKGGLANDKLDLDQAIVNLKQTSTLIPDLENSLRAQNNSLCILLGRPPYDLAGTWPVAPIPTPPTHAAVGIPAELLRRRPDVRKAERIAAAQSEQIGIAVAELYPHFGLNGTIEWQADRFSKLFNLTKSMAGSIGPTFNWNILNYGRLTNRVRAQQAAFEALVYDYQQVILDAHADVENGLIGFFKTQEQLTILNESIEPVLEAESIAKAQYKSGGTDFNRVYTIQVARFNLQDQSANVQGQVALNYINIYRALGGGWEIRFDNPSTEETTPMNGTLVMPMVEPPSPIDP